MEDLRSIRDAMAINGQQKRIYDTGASINSKLCPRKTDEVLALERENAELRAALGASEYESKQLRHERDLLASQIQSSQNFTRDNYMKLIDSQRELEEALKTTKTDILSECKYLSNSYQYVKLKLQKDLSSDNFKSLKFVLDKIESSQTKIVHIISNLSSAKQDLAQIKHTDERIDPSILEICDFLEVENAKLETQLQASKAEINLYKSETSANKVVPHYRLALTKLRSQSVQILKELVNEQESCKLLKEQLASVYDELRKAYEIIYKLKSKRAVESDYDDYINSNTGVSILEESINELELEIDNIKERLLKSSWDKTKLVLRSMSQNI